MIGSETDPFERACIVAMWLVVGLAFLTLALPFIAGGERLTGSLAFKQDFYVAPLFLVILLLARRWSIVSGNTAARSPRPQLWVAASIVLILAVGWAGHYLVFDGFDLSRDEQMATFDAAIFRGGDLFAPIPNAWRPIANSLNLVFILPIGDRQYWVSSYLPIHSLWRALVGLIADPALASPLMAACGGFCIWRVSRLLWPAATGVQLACVAFYAGSSQVLITAMTGYSMSMHVALNMLWLWLFLLDRRTSHLAAMIVGWFAAGIHQPVFHAMFVAPFFLMLLGQKRWNLLAAYVATYAVIGAFWLGWPIWVSAHGSAPALPIHGTGGVGFFDRFLSIFGAWNNDPPWIMAANLLRFVCWQHPLLLPCAIVGLGLNFRKDPVCRSLAIGFVLPIAISAILLPWQGYGWGYRYVHPVLGNAVLLAGYGWQALSARHVNLGPLLKRSTGLALLVIFPFFALTTHRIVSPFSDVRRTIASTPADIVIVDTAAAAYSDDIVFNRADLSNRPITLLAGSLKPSDLSIVCKQGSVAFLPGERLSRISQIHGGESSTHSTPKMVALINSAIASRCRVIPISAS